MWVLSLQKLWTTTCHWTHSRSFKCFVFFFLTKGNTSLITVSGRRLDTAELFRKMHSFMRRGRVWSRVISGQAIISRDKRNTPHAPPPTPTPPPPPSPNTWEIKWSSALTLSAQRVESNPVTLRRWAHQRRQTSADGYFSLFLTIRIGPLQKGTGDFKPLRPARSLARSFGTILLQVSFWCPWRVRLIHHLFLFDGEHFEGAERSV